MRAWRRRKKNELLHNTPPVGKSNRRRDPVEVSGTFSNLSLVYKICNSLYLLITKEYSLFQAKPTCNYVSMTKMTIKLPVHPISCPVRVNKCLEWWGSYCFGIQACNGWFHGDSKVTWRESTPTETLYQDTYISSGTSEIQYISDSPWCRPQLLLTLGVVDRLPLEPLPVCNLPCHAAPKSSPHTTLEKLWASSNLRQYPSSRSSFAISTLLLPDLSSRSTYSVPFWYHQSYQRKAESRQCGQQSQRASHQWSWWKLCDLHYSFWSLALWVILSALNTTL